MGLLCTIFAQCESGPAIVSPGPPTTRKNWHVDIVIKVRGQTQTAALYLVPALVPIQNSACLVLEIQDRALIPAAAELSRLKSMSQLKWNILAAFTL